MAACLVLGGCYGSSSTIGGDADTHTTPDAADSIPSDTHTDPVPPPADYALHEWGVFVWEDGVTTLHGPTPEVGEVSIDKPVIYVHSGESFTLDLTVGFDGGAARETWPLVPLGPAVEWTGVQVRPGPCDATPFPSVYDEPWFEEPCETCTLHTCVVDGASCLTHSDTVSTLLFYNGSMPSYEPPLEGQVWREGTAGSLDFSLSNDSGRTVESVWFLYRQTTSVEGCFPGEFCPVIAADLALMYFDRLDPHSGMGGSVEIVRLEAELDESGWPVPGTLGSWDEWEALAGELHAALEERGLFTVEADAFLAAWDTTLFGLLGYDSYYVEPMYRDGGALLYFMGRAEYDERLPLEASPAPRETVRVGMVYQHL
jgi:hypothetical protein